MSLRRRVFPEVLENLLTAVSGGVAAESHPFPPPGANGSPFRHDLQRPPVADVVSVHGSRDGQPHLFRKGVDYELLDAPQPRTLEWKEGAELPDEGTLIQVNYRPESARSVLTDLHAGSVVRTLSESIALEMAGLYAQLEAVYQSGFVDTATGSSLDNVVALLGIERVTGGRAAGEVEFTRSPGSRGIINIPAGTRVTTSDRAAEYETTGSLTLADGQNTIRVVARDLREASDPEARGPLPADALTVLATPIAGIESVTNPAPTSITTQDETDAELRLRAKNFLHGSERATLGAIKESIARQGITADVVEPEGAPGYVEITLHAETISPEQEQRLLTAIEESRPAGVKVMPPRVQPPRKVNLELRLTTASGLLEQDLRAAQRSVREKIEDYFARLPVREAGSINRIVGLVLSVPGVEDVRLLSATWLAEDTVEDVLDTSTGQLRIGGFPTVLGNLQIADPNLPTLLNVTIFHPEDENPPNVPEIQTALSDALTYLNALNATELPSDAAASERSRRVLSYGKLLRILPLPGKPGASLRDYDDAVASGTPPALPDETTVTPYRVQFVFTLESGLSRILAEAADEDYTLTPFERLSLGNVEAQPEADDG
jgi:Baseplate J-like protein